MDPNFPNSWFKGCPFWQRRKNNVTVIEKITGVLQHYSKPSGLLVGILDKRLRAHS